jgi:hypothetical protein
VERLNCAGQDTKFDSKSGASTSGEKRVNHRIQDNVTPLTD